MVQPLKRGVEIIKQCVHQIGSSLSKNCIDIGKYVYLSLPLMKTWW